MGRKVFIKEGQSLTEAMRASGKFKKGEIETGGGSNKEGAVNIKEQIKGNLPILNKSNAVATISKDEITDNFDKAAKAVQQELSKTKGVVVREGFGKIQVGSRLWGAKAYLKTIAEKTAVLAVPAILRSGMELKGHDDHKKRGYSTVTFAGKISVNGETGIVAVVVKKTTGNFYKIHRILDTNGKPLEIKTPLTS
jgi:hypothetical protein